MVWRKFEMLKVLYITTSYFPTLNGTTLRANNLFKPLKNKKLCEFRVLTPRKNAAGKPIYKVRVEDYEIIDGVHVHRVEKPFDLIGAIRRICKQYPIDVIEVRHPRFALYGFLSNVRKPIILHLGSIECYNNLVKRLLAKFTYRISNKIIVLSRSAKEVLVNKFNIQEDKIEVIINGVDIEEFNSNRINNIDIRKKYHISERYIVGYVGKFGEWEGLRYLIKCVPYVIKEVKSVKFFLVGYGSDFDYVNNLVKKLGIEDKVILPGDVLPEDVPSYIDSMDVFVIPRISSLTTETAIPLKVLEAMAMGKAIIGTKVAGLAEVIDNNKNGILINPDDEEQLANAIIKVLRNSFLRNQLGINARRKIETNCEYRWDFASRKLYKLYSEVVNKRTQ
ncbi:MAG: hypothetical protein DRI23_13355 [Candidatus Cloacimonadota bacterium]|nr:MAG: hypothetical protein DRI23_13355 [Candidatus Cloacimonadota bacterium]